MVLQQIYFQDLNNFTFGAFIGRFQSDGAASMAVKGLSNRLSVTD